MVVEFQNSDTNAKCIHREILEFLRGGANQPPNITTLLDERYNFPSQVWIGLSNLINPGLYLNPKKCLLKGTHYFGGKDTQGATKLGFLGEEKPGVGGG